ncbi:MAG TPA: SurA N-terminal domain-containing protein [Candidatus Megaira endosymbiont of Nemacystus decipiens]|nr:SurA N-terminal domain-containing protein [Candidatus Megaera endosymbiont of Nemacystus decipiens]
MKKTFAIITLIITCFSNQAFAEKDIVALVNDYPITSYDLEARKELLVNTQNITFNNEEEQKIFHKRLLEQLIEEHLISDTANQMGININDDTLDSVIRSIEKRNNLPDGGMVALLEDKGLSVESYRDQIRYELIKSNIFSTVAEDITVSESEIYDTAINNKDSQLNIRVWLFESYGNNLISYKKLEKLKAELQSYKGDIDETIFRNFVDKVQEIKDYNKLLPKMKLALKETQEKNTTAIFQDGGNLYVMLVLEKGLSATKEQMAKIKDDITNTKIDQKVELFLKKIRNNADIVYP